MSSSYGSVVTLLLDHHESLVVCKFGCVPCSSTCKSYRYFLFIDSEWWFLHSCQITMETNQKRVYLTYIFVTYFEIMILCI